MAASFEINDGWLTINGVRIAIDVPGHFERYRESDDALYMAKAHGHIEAYRRLVAAEGYPRSIIELGVLRGGSVAYFHEFLEHPLMLCIEYSTRPIPRLDEYCAAHPDIDLHLGIDQGDRATVQALAERFGEFDWVIDDASHRYGPTLASFEVLFPRLRPGGLYIIEDWNWSHGVTSQKSDHYFAADDALTNLGFSLVVAVGGHPGLFAEFYAGPPYMWVRRGHAHLPTDGSFRLADYLRLRGRSLTPI